MADKRTEFNLGESGKTSVKVHHNPGGQSNWSLGWDNETKPKMPSKSSLIQFKSITTKVTWCSEVRTSSLIRKNRERDWKKRRKRKKNWTITSLPLILKWVGKVPSSSDKKTLITTWQSSEIHQVASQTFSLAESDLRLNPIKSIIIHHYDR